MQLDSIAFNLTQYVEQITGVKADFETIIIIAAGNFFCRSAVFGASDGQSDFVLIQCHFDGARFFCGDGGHAVNALGKAFGINAQQFVISGRNDTGVIGECSVNQL